MNGIVLLNQSDAILAARLRSARPWPSDQISGLRIYAFLAFLGCVERQVTPVGSLDAPPRRLSWTGRTVLLALEMRAVHDKAPGMCRDYELHIIFT